jgi:hypothetical protein
MQNRNSLSPPHIHMYIVVFYVGEYVWGVGVGGWLGVYTKSKSSELSPLRPPLRSKNWQILLPRCLYNKVGFQ